MAVYYFKVLISLKKINAKKKLFLPVVIGSDVMPVLLVFFNQV